MKTFPEVERRRDLSPDEFFESYVDQKSVVMEDMVVDWAASGRWNTDYFCDVIGDMRIKVKPGYLPTGAVDFLPFKNYAQLVIAYEEQLSQGEAGPEDRPPYLHDIPMLSMCPRLVDDAIPFPVAYLPKWYRSQWWEFSQFFFGPTHSLTPMHFDSLETHNTFFQVAGRKRFVLVAPQERQHCYLYKWRWSHVDPDNPDFEKHPDFLKVSPTETTLNPGDVLYMPPRTLHHVQSLDLTISFNIDWQTAKTALRGAAAIFRGMPLENVYYNSVAAAGLLTGLPSRVLFPLYKPYLDYVS